MDYREFSKKVKEKYPQYANQDDRVLAQKVIEKYPQYSYVTFDDQPTPSPLPAVPERKSFGPGDIGEAFGRAAGAMTGIPGVRSLTGKAGRWAGENPKEAVDISLEMAPTMAGLGGMALAAPAAVPMIGAAALGTAAGKTAQVLGRKAIGSTTPTTPSFFGMDVPQIPGVPKGVSDVIGETALQGGLDAATLGLGKVAGLAPKAGKALKGPIETAIAKTKGFMAKVVDALPGLKGTGETAVKATESTKPGFSNAAKMEEFSGNLIKSMAALQKKTKGEFAKTVANIDKVAGEGRVPAKDIVIDFMSFKKNYDLGRPGIQKLSKQTQDAFNRIEKELADEVQGKTAFNLSDLINLRQRIKKEIDFGKTEAGQGIDSAALKNLYDSIDDRIKNDSVYGIFKQMDADYEDMIKTTKDVKTAFGIPAEKDLDKLSLVEKKAIEARITNSLSKGSLEEKAISKLDEKLGTKATLFEAQKIATGAKFEPWLTNRGLTMGAALGSGFFHPLAAAGVIGGALATGPRGVGAALRTGKRFADFARSGKISRGIAKTGEMLPFGRRAMPKERRKNEKPR